MTDSFDPFDRAQWVDDPGCEPFEMALAMRERGALPSASITALEAHLADCAFCRAHMAATAHVDASLASAAAPPSTHADDERVRQKLRANLRRARRGPWILGAVMLGVSGLSCLLGFAFGETQPSLGSSALLALALVGVLVGPWLWRLRRAQRLMTPTFDVVGTYRRQLQGRIANLEKPKKLLLGLVALDALRAVSAWRGVTNGEDRRVELTMVCLFVAAGLAVVIAQPLMVRRLKRELAGLR
jgi:anti-sigma factor RsiW